MASGAKYSESFFETHTGRSSESAAVVVPLVIEMVHPDSVVDVGCGVGAWLAQWQRHGIGNILGIDGDYVDRSQLLISSSHFMAANLEHPPALGRRFGLAACLEVGEHLDPVSAPVLVRFLCEHADTVLFSAAVPGQGGTHHVNEQWPSYWAALFAAQGFRAFDAVRPLIWDDDRVEFWYRQNTLLYSRDREFPGADPVLNMVHPRMWLEYKPTLRQITEFLPGAVTAAVRYRLHR